MMTKLVWRLGKLPSPDEVRELVKDKIITQEEAREILFKQENEEDRDKKSLEEEIKFLRTLVEKLSSGGNIRIIETIRTIEKPCINYPWYQPYYYWSNGGGTMYHTNGIGADNLTAGAGSSIASSDTMASFSEIKTF